MRRLLLAALVLALLVGAFVGVASARLAVDGSGSVQRDAAPFRAPAALPRAVAGQPGSYAFRSLDAIAASLAPPPAAGAPSGGSSSGGASATVTVTATVLPVVMLVVDPGTGELQELFTNTTERSATGVVYIVRLGMTDGAPGTLTRDGWRTARAALASADAGTGTIWRN